MSKSETVTLVVKKPFDWAHDHVRVVSYAKDNEIETSDADLIKVAKEEGWAEEKKGSKAKKSGLSDEVKAQIAELETKIAAATDEEKPALQQQLADLQAQ